MSDAEADSGPKTRFRWPLSRQRAVELIVVIFGVLIALGLENLIEEIRLRGDAMELERAFDADLGEAVQLSLERQAVSPCLVGRLKALEQRVLTPGDLAAPVPAASGGSITFALPAPYRAPTRVWITSSFDRALGTEAFKRIPRERADSYAGVFAQIVTRQQANDDEFFAVAGLAPLVPAQGELDPEVRADLLRQLALLDRHQALAAIQGRQIISAVMAMPVGERIRAELREGPVGTDWLAGLRSTYGDCVDTTAVRRLLVAPDE
jgi:hypothetical protein